jgi:translocator protein
LSRPSWAPPGWLFGPVWSFLYLCMAISAWLVWRVGGWKAAGGQLTLFVVQLMANALWSWLFFAWHKGALASVEIVVLWVLIVATTVSFARIQKAAGWLLIPYLAWVTFATALCFTTWRMNPGVL